MLLVKAYFGALAVVSVLDALWLGLIARDWLAAQLGELRREKVLIGPAAAFYLFYPAAVALLAVQPAAGAGWLSAAGLGAVLGLAAFGAYDLTNWATLKNWPVPMSLVDIVWGALLTASAAAGGWWLARVWT
jgi:uncharacterized membrane protein